MSLSITRPSIPVPLPLTRGGTDATTAAGARAALELGDLATLTAPGGATQFLRADTNWAVPPGGGGVSTFLELTDAPDTYTGQGGLSVRVNAGATALEFAALPAASETALGLVELATPAEVQAGTDTTRAVTAAGLAAKFPLTTKGDLLVRDASALTRLPVGTDGQVLMADAALSLGVTWATPPSGGTNYWSRVDLGASTLPTGLLAYWPLEEATGQRLDAVGTNHLTPTGSDANVSSAAGKIGNALAMNGTAGTYLSVADNATLSAGADQSFSVACWVYVTNTGLNHGFVGKGSAAVVTANVEYMLWQYSGVWRFDVGNGSTFATAVSSFAPVANQWCLLIGWYDAAADLQYIQVNNGTPVAVANSAGSYDSTLPFEVGRTVGFSTQSLDGRVDMLLFAKRVWTAQERADLWNGGSGLAYPFAVPSRLSPSTVQDQLLLAATPLTTERLEVDGALKLGNALGTVDGTLRWSGTDFEGRKAGAWVSLTQALTLPLAIADGGTGATTAGTARTALGLGTLATQDAGAVAITGGSATGLSALATGGTGDISAARNLVANGQLFVTGTSQLANNVGLRTAPAGNVALSIDYAKASTYGVVLRPSDSDTGVASAMLFSNLGNTPVGSITTTASATAFNTSSDVRLKHAIATLAGALERVRALRPVAFRWNADDSAGHGFLAHELQQVVPEAVTGEPDALNPDGSVRPQQVDASKIVVWLCGAVQELAARLQALEEALGA